MTTGTLGKAYKGGEIIVREGESGNCMFVIQEGEVEVIRMRNDSITRLALLGEGDFFGEMALFEREKRAATVRAIGDVRVLTVDKNTFLHRIQRDPTLAFRIVETLSHRIRKLDDDFMDLYQDHHRNNVHD